MTLRVWDIFLLEGFPIMFRIALALIAVDKDELLSYSADVLYEYLKSLPQRITDSGSLLAAALKIKKTSDIKEPKSWDFLIPKLEDQTRQRQ